MTDDEDIIAKGMREFRQNTIGTAQTPPAEWMNSFIAVEAYNKARALEERLDRIEARLDRLLEGR